MPPTKTPHISSYIRLCGRHARYLIGHHTVTEARAGGRKLAIVVLGLGRWSLIKSHVARVIAAVSDAKPGSLVEVEIPHM